jgi:hypothetical protein
MENIMKKNPSNVYEIFHGNVYENFHGVPWKIPCNSMEFNGFPWNFPWKFPWNPMENSMN